MSQPGGMFNDPSSNPPVTGEGNKVPFPWWFQNWETIPSQDGNLGPKTAVTSSLDLALGPQDDPASSQNMERVCVCVCVLVIQSCLTFCNPMDCSPPGSSVHGILQARIQERVAIPFSMDVE